MGCVGTWVRGCMGQNEICVGQNKNCVSQNEICVFQLQKNLYIHMANQKNEITSSPLT